MNRLRSLYYFVIIFLIGGNLSAQDPHFSQFYANPLLVNPALTGTGDGSYRISSIYRDQWRGALDEPFKTFGLSADFGFSINERASNHPDRFGIGINIFADRVGTFDFNTTAISVFGSFHKALDKVKNSYLSGGFSIGLGQKNVNYEDLNFQDQFNAIDGYTLPTGEFLPANNFGYADMSIGVHYSMHPSKETHVYGGVGVYHFNRPNISFYRSDDSNNPDLIRENRLDIKFSVYGGVSLPMSEKWDIQPRVLTLFQGNHSEYNLGNNFRYLLDDELGRYLHIGPWLRLTEDVDGLGLEAIVFSAGLQLGNMIFGVSYDHNLGDLTGPRRGLGAFEISFNYSGDFNNEADYCPTF